MSNNHQMDISKSIKMLLFYFIFRCKIPNIEKVVIDGYLQKTSEAFA